MVNLEERRNLYFFDIPLTLYKGQEIEFLEEVLMTLTVLKVKTILLPSLSCLTPGSSRTERKGVELRLLPL